MGSVGNNAISGSGFQKIGPSAGGIQGVLQGAKK